MNNLSMYKVFAIKINGKKIGTISALFDNDIPNSVCLKSFKIYKEYQNRGFGTKALKQVLDILKPKFDLIYCNADIGNERAVHVYEKFGKVKDMRDYYTIVFKDTNKYINDSKPVRYNQSGYVGNSMSVRAKEAYENGEMPISKWTKNLILEKFEEEAKYTIDDETYNDVLNNMKKASLSELKNYALSYSSWHHVGVFAKAVDFYSLDVDDCINHFASDDVIEKKRQEEELKRKKEEERENQKLIKKNHEDLMYMIDFAKKNNLNLRKFTTGIYGTYYVGYDNPQYVSNRPEGWYNKKFISVIINPDILNDEDLAIFNKIPNSN